MQDSKVCSEGDVQFKSTPSVTFAYKILRSDDSVKICLQDRETYHRW